MSFAPDIDGADDVDVSSEEWADNSGNCCPNCERPNQFGELCAACVRERDAEPWTFETARRQKGGTFGT